MGRSFFATSLLLAVLTTAPVRAAVPDATAPVRDGRYQGLVASLKPSTYDLTLHPLSDTAYWQRVLWTMTLVQPVDRAAQQALSQLLDRAAEVNPPERTLLLQALKTSAALYLRPVQPATRVAYNFVPEKLTTLLNTSRDPALVALALASLSRERDMSGLLPQLKARFPLWFLDIPFRTTIEAIAQPAAPLPPLADLLNYQFTSLPQLYLLCRPDRTIPCLSLLKDGQGKFALEGEQPWSRYLLARSVYPLGWNFNSGETPQGLLRLSGTIPRTPQEFRPFGQFPSIKVFLPNEKGLDTFIPGVTTAFDLGVYRSLWPSSWQNYRPIEQSFWAGQLGRNLIRIHGSGEDPRFFYPEAVDLPNPTIGCIGAKEHYGPDGELQQADLPSLLAAWERVQPGSINGFLWLIEVPGPNLPVTLDQAFPKAMPQ